MDERMAMALSFSLLGLAVAVIAVQAATTLAGKYTELRLKATEQQRDMPPLVVVYFRNTTRVLAVTAFLFTAVAAADIAVSHLWPGVVPARTLGFGSAVVLLVCSLGLLVQGMTDRQLQLQTRPWRIAHIAAGGLGVLNASAGMAITVWKGGIWWP